MGLQPEYFAQYFALEKNGERLLKSSQSKATAVIDVASTTLEDFRNSGYSV